MKQNHSRRRHRAALGLFGVFSLFASQSYAVPAAMTSRTESTAGGQRLAVYELVRSGVDRYFAGPL